MRSTRRGSRGFTLVELAIVLVIVGLLLGAILKGEGMVYNAKLKNVVKQADGIRAAIYTYVDLYKVLPGDDPHATAHVGASHNGDGNGHINGNEHLYMFEHLKRAGLVSGDYDGSTLPVHAFGDNVYVYWYNVKGEAGHWICFQNLSGRAARDVDYLADDGDPDDGGVRAYSGDYDQSQVTLCFAL